MHAVDRLAAEFGRQTFTMTNRTSGRPAPQLTPDARDLGGDGVALRCRSTSPAA